MTRHALALLTASLVLPACTPDLDEAASDGTGTTFVGIDPGHTSTPTTGGAAGEAEDGSTTTGEDVGDSSSTTDISCTFAEIVAEPEIPNVVLVLDKSGSMVASPAGYWDADGDDADDDGVADGDPNDAPATAKVTRWRSLHDVVEFIVTDFEARMDFGAVLFPSTAAVPVYDESACPVNAAPEVAVGPDQAAAILAAIPAADSVQLHGGTPAAAGVTTAVQALAGLDPERDRYMILVTDGAANCSVDAPDDFSRFESYDEALPQAVADAAAQGIRTFVVGIDIDDGVSPVLQDGNPDEVNPYARLNAVAEAGGMARAGAEKFYNTQNQVELQAALMNISVLITSCVLTLDPVPVFLQQVGKLAVDPDGADPLIYGDEEVSDCASESGWHFTDPSRAQIELCGAACELYRQTGQVAISFVCEVP